eukprot:SAG31_NODE_5572_length_2450_cov_1.395151_2_plen_234_part_00
MVPVYDVFMDFVSTLNTAAPTGLRSAKAVQTSFSIDGDSRSSWTWAMTQKGLVNNIFTGFAICFPAAFLTLMVATRNAYVSLIATLTIAFIVASVLGLCKAYLGWALGVAEEIAAVIVIGFSVDFTVHFAHMYIECDEHFRVKRFAYAARTMGMTVVMGACTTFCSGCVLWLCTLTFFTKFAVLVVSTIGFSLAYAVFFFMPLLALVGPQGDCCDAVVLMKDICGKSNAPSGP